MAQATGTLTMLGALAPESLKITEIGRQMSLLPMHPRLSRMLVAAAESHCLRRGCLWAALISEREILLPGAKNDFADDLPEGLRSDFLVLERAIDTARHLQFDAQRCASRGLNAQAAREVDKTAQLFESAARSAGLRVSTRESDGVEAIAKALLLAFPDHLALRLNPKNNAAALTNNRRAQLDEQSVAQGAGLILPIEITEIGAGSTAKTILSLVTELDPQWVRDILPHQIQRQRIVEFNPDTRAVEAVERDIINGLVIEQSPPRDPDPKLAAPILAEQVIRGQLKLAHWDEEVEQWIARTRCLAKWFPERRLITYSEEELHLIIEEICQGATRYKDIANKPILPAVKDALSYDDQRFVEQMAPDRIQLPRGWRMKVHYDPNSPPKGRAKIQDFYGLEHTPTIAGGRQKLLLEILGPNMRPLQLTDDLANFWRNLYPELKKQLSRRYPRHEWR
jgi:ATP-dependent helicase HrpB